MPLLSILPIFLAVLWVMLAFVHEFRRKPQPVTVHYDTAIEAVKLLKDWGVWMTTIATAAIAANGFLIQSSTGGARSLFASISIFSFVGSVLLDAWLIGCLPAVVLTLKYKTEHPDNDIYERSLFSFLPKRVSRVGFVGNIQHTLFIIAVYTLALSVHFAPVGKIGG